MRCSSPVGYRLALQVREVLILGRVADPPATELPVHSSLRGAFEFRRVTHCILGAACPERPLGPVRSKTRTNEEKSQTMM